jgi:lambda family phage tail tape measure protein
MADSIIKDLTRIFVRKAIGSLLGGLLGGPAGMGIGGSIGGMMGGASSSYMMGGYQVPLFAKGAAFGPGGLTAFARGGVVNSPITFPFKNGTGLMGEAGPEAIMPLTRGPGGKLGVMAMGGGGNLKIEIINNAGQQIRASDGGTRNEGGLDIQRIIIDTVAGDVGSGQGVLNRVFENKYGLDPTVGLT